MKRRTDREQPSVPDLAFGLPFHRAQWLSEDLQRLDEALTAVASALLQESNRTAGTIIGVATSKLVAAGVMAGTFGGIAAVGTASTGAAIASLSGAAATTATLYWIGSSVGMGAAAGSLMLTGGAIAAGIPAAMLVRRRVLGRRRTEKDLSSREQAALYAALRLAAPMRALRASATPLVSVEIRVFAQQGLMPLTAALDNLYVAEMQNDEYTPCTARPGSLAYWPRQRLRRALEQLDSTAKRWAEA